VGQGIGAMGGVSAIWLPLVSVLPQLFSYQSCLVAGQNGSLQISSNWLENCYCKLPCLALSLAREN